MINPEPSVGPNRTTTGSKVFAECLETLERNFIENTVRFELMKAIVNTGSDKDIPNRKKVYELVADIHETYVRWAKQMRDLRQTQ